MKLLGKNKKNLQIYAIVVGFLVSPVFSIFQSNLASANNYNQMTALARMKLQDGLKILEFCENNGGKLIIPSGHGTSVNSEWKFYTVTSSTIDGQTYTDKTEFGGAILTLPAYYDNTSIDCGQLFTRFSGYFGITDGKAFLDDAGFSDWINNQRTHTGGCNNNRATELSCLKYAIKKRVSNYVDGWDDQMYYMRNKLILDAQKNGSNPGGCFAHWTSKTQPGELDVAAWTKQYNNRNDDGILGTLESPQIIKLVNDVDNPERLVDYFVMSEGGDGNDGWQKFVNTTVTTDGSNITDGNPARCVSLANALNDSRSQNYIDWMTNWIRLHPGEERPGTLPPQNDGSGTATTSCAIEGVGWIVCPVLSFVAAITDGVYNLIENWLKVDTSLYSEGSGTENGWQAMRNIANIGFVIIFLIVIFSQLTGAGISNYGVKKTLPRLVVVAILINISFFLMQIAVDVSNIVGASLNDFFRNIPVFNGSRGSFFDSGNQVFSSITTFLLAGATANITVAAIGIAAVGAFAYGGMALLILVLLAGLLSVLTVMAILAARQALIIVLIVAAPVALLAMILPNTKKWFDKWKQLLIAMLVLYPAVGALFGLSQMAANIIVQGSGQEINITQALLGLAVATIPLFAVIPMLKGALNAVPIAGKLAARLSKSAALGGSIKGRAKQARTNFGNDMRSRALNVEGDGRMGRAARWLGGGRARSVARDRRFGANVSRDEAAYISAQALAPGSGASNSEMAAAVGAQHKLEEEEIANIMTLDKHNNRRPADHLAVLSDPNSSHAQRVAAVRAIGATGGQGDVNRMAELSALGHLSAGERSEIADVAAKRMGTNNPAFGGAQIAQISSGGFDANRAYLEHARSNNMTAQSLLAMHDGTRSEMIRQIKLSGDAQANAALQRITAQIEGNEELQAKAGQALVAELNRPATAPDNTNPGPITPASAAEVHINHGQDIVGRQ